MITMRDLSRKAKIHELAIDQLHDMIIDQKEQNLSIEEHYDTIISELLKENEKLERKLHEATGKAAQWEQVAKEFQEAGKEDRVASKAKIDEKEKEIHRLKGREHNQASQLNRLNNQYESLKKEHERLREVIHPCRLYRNPETGEGS